MNNSNFSKIRSFFWPIHRYELSRFIPMLLLFFFISFNYHILKILKDTLIITAPNSGAEVIPFLKVYAILPSAILITFLFTKLSSKFNRENIFYVVMTFFLSFFILFITVLYPHAQFYNLNSFAEFLTTKLPAGFKGFILIIKYWHFSLFYIMAEAWSTIMLSLLLWIFIVDVLSVDQAKRYYAFLGVARNSAGIISGFFCQYLAKSVITSPFLVSFAQFFGYKSDWDQKLLLYITTVFICGIFIACIYRYLHVYIYPKRYLLGSSIKDKGKQKISLKQSISYILKSKYVLYIISIVLAYNILNNLIEMIWKSQIHELYPTSVQYSAYTSKITSFTGMVAIFFSFFISGNLVRRMGWKISALLTPIVLILTNFGFFYFLFLKKYAVSHNITMTLFGLSPLVLAVMFGSLQDVFSRALKYTIFDDTKEMAFIPLKAEEKLQSKAAIDGIGSRLGKSGSSFIMQILIMLFASPIGASPYVFGIILLIMPVWISAINKLSKQFEEKTLATKEELESSA